MAAYIIGRIDVTDWARYSEAHGLPAKKAVVPPTANVDEKTRFCRMLANLGSEPVIVDCGSLRNRTGWLDDVFGLVAPEDVRWIFLSHDDADHTANVGPVMEACPRGHARLQLGPRRALCQRLRVPALEMPLGEPRRRLQCRRPDPRGPAPPVYDSPTTRGLLDTTTGVYWAADAFATPVPGGPGASPPDHVNELDPELWWGGMVM